MPFSIKETMGKVEKKATKKLIKKGRLDFASRATKKRGDGRSPATVHTRRGQARPNGLGPSQRKGRGTLKGQDHLRKPVKQRQGDASPDNGDTEEPVGDGRGATQDPNGFADMDVDAFLGGGIFGDIDGEGSGDEADDVEDDEGGAGSADEDEKEATDDEEEAASDAEGGEEEHEDEDALEEEDAEEAGLKDEVRKHKAELERLKKRDPDFFKFLEQNDQTLLAFGDDDDEEEDDDDEAPIKARKEASDEEELKAQMEQTAEDTDAARRELTLSMLSGLERSAFKSHSVKALRKIVLAFKCASQMADEASAARGRGSGPYDIASSVVFDKLLVTCLTSLPGAFARHLLGNEDFNAMDPSPLAKAFSTSAFGSIKPMVYRALKALSYMLSQVTEASLLHFMLLRLERFVPFLIPFPRQAKLYLKILVNLWATSDAVQVKLAAFLRIRQAATVLPFPFVEHCLKASYLAYARNCKFVSESSLPGLTLMGNCLVELYGLDMTSSYQHAFVYIRQLALHLRSAYTKKTSEALQKVHGWQYVNCVKAWVAVLTAYPGPDQLRDLVFPLSQVVLGLVKLAPSARHYPLLFHCVGLLQRLAARTQVFIPCGALLMDVLENPALQKKPKPTTAAPPNLSMAVKLGKDLLEPRHVQEAVVNEALELLQQEMDIYRYTIAFPEYAFPIKERLKRFAKSLKPTRWRAMVRGLVDDMDKRAAYVEKERSRREMAPTDAISFEALRPDNEPDAFARLNKVLMTKAGRNAPPGKANDVEFTSDKAGEGKARRTKAQQDDDEEDDDAEVEERGIVQNRRRDKGSKTASAANGLAGRMDVDALQDEVGGLDKWSEDDDDDLGGEAVGGAEEDSTAEDGVHGEEQEGEEGHEEEEDDDEEESSEGDDDD